MKKQKTIYQVEDKIQDLIDKHIKKFVGIPMHDLDKFNEELHLAMLSYTDMVQKEMLAGKAFDDDFEQLNTIENE
jgi:hypothetical protein